MFNPSRTPRRPWSLLFVLLWLALLAAPRAGATLLRAGVIEPCSPDCDHWTTAGGSVAMFDSTGFLLHSTLGCDQVFTFSSHGGDAPFAAALTVMDSAATTVYASGSGELSWTTWVGGPLLIVVTGVDSAAGAFTLAAHCHCAPQPYVNGPATGYQDHEVALHCVVPHDFTSDITSYEWDFGDGSSESGGEGVTHTYAQQGEYSIGVTVTDACGAQGWAGHTVRVFDCDANPPAPPPPDRQLTQDGPQPPFPRHFGDDTRVTTSPGQEIVGRQMLAAAPDGVVHMVYGVDRFWPYYPQDDGSVYHREWNPAFGTWATEEQVVALAAPKRTRNVAMAVDGLGGLHVIWTEGDGPTNLRLNYRHRRPDRVWEAVEPIRQLPELLTGGPSIGADSLGDAFVAWGEGANFHSNVYCQVRRGATGQWLNEPVALTAADNLVVTEVNVAIQNSLAPAIEIAHVAWCQRGGEDGEIVAHRMLWLRRGAAPVYVEGHMDHVPAYSACALASACTGDQFHMLFDTCFIGAATPAATRATGPRSAAGFGGPRQVVSRTRLVPADSSLVFEFRTPEDPTGLPGGVSSNLTVDRFGDLHLVLGEATLRTIHATWSVKDNRWTSGEPIRDVPSGYQMESSVVVAPDGRVLVGWMDHRAPDSPCSGEIYADVGVCTPPPPINALRVRNAGTGRHLQLTWAVDSTATACRYVIYRKLARDAAWDSVADVAAPPYLDGPALVKNTRYAYRVRPYSLCREQGSESAAITGIPRFPLVMVHGCCGGNPSAWTDMKRYLTDGPGAPYEAGDIWPVQYDSWGPVMLGAGVLTAWVQGIQGVYDARFDLARNGAQVDSIDIVAHSMGGVVSRFYVQRLHGHVRRLITLSSPHAGTDWAMTFAGQIRHGGSFAMFDMTRTGMKFLNRIMHDIPWRRCTPPSYHLAGGRISVLDPCLHTTLLLERPNDGTVPVSSALYPGGCDRRVFDNICHTRMNTDTLHVGPWVADHLLLDSLGVTGPMPPPPLLSTPELAAEPDSAPPAPVLFVRGHALGAPATVDDTVHVDAVARAVLGLATFGAAGSVTLTDPLGHVIDSTFAAADPQVDYDVLEDEEGTWRRFDITNPTPGDWIIHTSATATASGADDFVNFAVAESPLLAELQLPDRELNVGESTPLLATITQNGQTLPGCVLSARVRAPDLSEQTLPLFDDGAHGDGAAGDGVYGSALLAAGASGAYTVLVTGTGVGAGGAFTRAAAGLLLVGDQYPPGIALRFPVGGETLLRGAAQRARWEAWDDTGVDSVRVELSLDDGATYTRRLGVAAGADTALTWTAPDTVTTHARVRVTAFDATGKSWSDASRASFRLADASGGVEPPHPAALPALAPPAPNPFRTATVMAFVVPARAPVRLTVYDVAGRLLRTLVDEPLDPGRYQVAWSGETDNGRHVSSGVYFVRLDVEGLRLGRKVLMVK